jgi:hypothetical protein
VRKERETERERERETKKEAAREIGEIDMRDIKRDPELPLPLSLSRLFPLSSPFSLLSLRALMVLVLNRFSSVLISL